MGRKRDCELDGFFWLERMECRVHCDAAGDAFVSNVGTLDSAAAAEIDIALTRVPFYGSGQRLGGKVSGGVPGDHQVAVYINVGGQWYTKPYFVRPLSHISRQGNFTVDIVTGGSDELAQEIAVFVVPKGAQVPLANGPAELPAALFDLAAAWTIQERLADLQVEIVAVHPQSVAPGRKAVVEMRISNTSDIGIRRKVVTDLRIDGELAASKLHSLNLRPGGTRTLRMSVRIPTDLAPGPHQIQAVVDSTNTAMEMDESNNTAVATFTVPGVVMPGVVILRLDSQSDTGLSSSDGITADDTPTFNGNAAPGVIVRLNSDIAGELGQATADGTSGMWSFTSGALAEGQHRVTASVRLPSGELQSPPLVLIIDTTAPQLASFALDPGFSTGGQGGQETTFAVVDLQGVAEPFARVELLPIGQIITSGAGGEFHFLDMPLAVGANDFDARATDVAGNTSTLPTRVIRTEVPQVPAIEITSLPTFGADGLLEGRVSGVDFNSHRVATFIQVEGSGWWTKPFLATPTVPINSDGTFSVDVVTGGLDDRATIYTVAVVAADALVPTAAGAGRIPASLEALALDTEVRFGRTLRFAGHTWGVKEAPLPVGPGGNRFSLDEGDVWVDEAGLHLTAHFRDGFWWSTEVVLLDSLGYGTYEFATTSPQDMLDPNATFGAFSWDSFGDGSAPGNPHREIDFEDSRWSIAPDPTTSQIVVQPFTTEGNLHRFTVPSTPLTRSIRWSPDEIEFVTLEGLPDAPGDPVDRVVHAFAYVDDSAAGHHVPDPGRAAFRFNLWLNNVETGHGSTPRPASDQPVEVVIADFKFSPPEASTGLVLLDAGLQNDSGISAVDGVTNDPTITGSIIGAETLASLTLTIPQLSGNAFDVTDLISSGRIAMSRAAIESRLGHTLADGQYTLVLQGLAKGGGRTNAATVSLTLDTVPPVTPTLELAAADDTGVPGDFETSFLSVSLVGVTEPESVVELEAPSTTTVPDMFGSFQFNAVPLTLGTNSFTVRAVDAAGNVSVTARVVTRVDDQGLIGGPGTPLIEFTSIPAIGSSANLFGRASHIAADEYRVAVYIKVGSGYWTKPYWASPTVALDTNGSWVADITTGGHDTEATQIVAFLIPVNFDPPLLGGQNALPDELNQNAVARVDVFR